MNDQAKDWTWICFGWGIKSEKDNKNESSLDVEPEAPGASLDSSYDIAVKPQAPKYIK